jgi:hypothetical protein
MSLPLYVRAPITAGTKVWNAALASHERYKWDQMEAIMPIILWLLGVPLVVVIALMITHVI